MKAHLINTHFLVPRSRSSAKVKVKYQGHVSQKIGVSRALVGSPVGVILYTFFISIKRNIISKKRNTISLKRIAISIKRNTFSIKRNTISLKRIAISLKRITISIK